jgi:two-component system, chemotaxis family, protein-glutamate methylesterase/glutaminase
MRAVVIGASAGAVEALSAILPPLPADYPLPILIVVHIPPDRASVMATLFASKCTLTVKESEDKELIQPGIVYFAAADYHLLVEQDGTLSFSADEPVLFSRPSINVLFESAADAYGSELIGIILSGTNSDGADGLRAVCDAGGVALVQSLKDSFGYEMPEAALASCPDARELSLEAIRDFLLRVQLPQETQ